jgi:hypothetical protein
MYVRDNFQTINQTLWLLFCFVSEQCLYCSFHRGLTGVARILLLLSWLGFYEDHLFLVSFALAFPDFNRDDHHRWRQYALRLRVAASHLLVRVELGCVVLRLLILLILLRGPVPSVVLLWRALHHHLLLLLLLLLGLLKYFFDWLAEITRPPVPECLLLGVALRSDLFLARLLLGSDRPVERGFLGLLLADLLVLLLLGLV